MRLIIGCKKDAAVDGAHLLRAADGLIDPANVIAQPHSSGAGAVGFPKRIARAAVAEAFIANKEQCVSGEGVRWRGENIGELYGPGHRAVRPPQRPAFAE